MHHLWMLGDGGGRTAHGLDSEAPIGGRKLRPGFQTGAGGEVNESRWGEGTQEGNIPSGSRASLHDGWCRMST